MKDIKNLIPLIILNWNGENDTISCLKSIRNSDNSRFVPIVVDNGSKRESLEILKKEVESIYPNIIYLNNEQISEFSSHIKDFILKSEVFDSLIFIENNENFGFAKGNNIGIKIAKLIDSEWVMLLNNDTEINYDALSTLDTFIKENNEIIAITPQIRLYTDKDKIWNCGGKLTFFGSRKYYYEEENIIKVPIIGYSFISFVTGCALLFQYKKTGILTEDFFFGEEDYEFSLRMKKNKFKMICLYNSIIYHKVGSTIKKSHNVIGSLYLYYINRLINTRNYYSTPRWLATKILAYVYLPALLIKNNLKPYIAFSLIKSIDIYITKNIKVDSNEFKRAINKL